MLDAGHGGRDPGAVYRGRQEKDDTLALTLAVGEILQDRGVDVLYTRTTDMTLISSYRSTATPVRSQILIPALNPLSLTGPGSNWKWLKASMTSWNP